jgi:adenosylhomocysteine nucleosidase
VTILVATGLQKEAAILGGRGVTVIAGGGDGGRLERELEAAVAGANMLVSCGLAGALAPGLKAGDLVIGEYCPGEGAPGRIVPRTILERAGHVQPGAGPVTQVPQLGPGLRRGSDLVEALRQHLTGAHVGTITGSDAIVASVPEKQSLYATTGALAVDMESHIAVRVAARHGLPFAIVRVISDAADHALPPAALVGMRPDGGIALGAVLGSLARNPRQLPALIRTGGDAGRAFAALRRVGDVLGRLGIGLADDLELPLNMR